MPSPSPILQFPDRRIVLISNIAGMKRVQNKVVIHTNDGRDITDTYATPAAAAAAYDAYVVLITAWNLYPTGGTGSTTPKLLAIMPNYVDENALFQEGGLRITAVGLNFAAGYYVDIEGSIGQLTNVTDTTIWELFSGAALIAGTYDVVLYDGVVEIDRIVGAFTVTAAKTGLVLKDTGDSTNKTITITNGIIGAS